MMSFANQRLLQAIESLGQDSKTKQQANSFAPYSFLPTNLLFSSAFGDEHLPYSPYYSSGVNSKSCASSFLSSPSSSVSVASAEDIMERKSTNTHSNTTHDHQLKTAFAGTSSPHDNENTRPCSVNPKHSNCDYYGFQWPIQWVDIETIYTFEQTYRTTLADQARKWGLFLETTNGDLPPLCPKLKRYVRKGVPRALRRLVWMNYSGAKRKTEQNPGQFKTLVDEAFISLDDRTVHTIDLELRHLFPDNIYFASGPMRDDTPRNEEFSVATDGQLRVDTKLSALRRILLAFHIHAPVQALLLQGSTTTRALAALAGFMMTVMAEASEEEVFWLLERLIFSYYDENSCTRFDPMVLMQLISEKMPGVWNKISSKQCFWDWVGQNTISPVALVTGHWFLTAFINILPVETVVRVWDCFIVEGYPILFRVALTIIKLSESEIDRAQDNIGVTRVLQNCPHRFLDCDDLLQRVFAKDAFAKDVNYQDIARRRNVLRNRHTNY